MDEYLENLGLFYKMLINLYHVKNVKNQKNL